MDKKIIENEINELKESVRILEQFEEVFEQARLVCDPIDFAARQHNLLHAIGHALINDLRVKQKLLEIYQDQVKK